MSYSALNSLTFTQNNNIKNFSSISFVFSSNFFFTNVSMPLFCDGRQWNKFKCDRFLRLGWRAMSKHAVQCGIPCWSTEVIAISNAFETKHLAMANCCTRFGFHKNDAKNGPSIWCVLKWWLPHIRTKIQHDQDCSIHWKTNHHKLIVIWIGNLVNYKYCSLPFSKR